MTDPVVGTTIDGRYAVTQRIARGGMGTVYLAMDTRLDRQVALKVMHPHLSDDETFKTRFYREAKTAASISHPGIVSVFDQGDDGHLTYLAMEYVPGKTLRDVIETDAPMSIRRTLAVVEQMLEALGAAHSAGLVHRDIKPENVLVTPEGRVKIADFGLARPAMTSKHNNTSGPMLGTIAYIAPEVVNEEGSDHRTDLYALGVLLFELLTGQQPFTGETALAIAYKHVRDDVPLPSSLASSIPRQLNELVLWATAKDRNARPDDAFEMLADVQQIRSELTPLELDSRPVVFGSAAEAGGQPTNKTVALPKSRGSKSTSVVSHIPQMSRVHEEEPVSYASSRSSRRSGGGAKAVAWVLGALLVVLLISAGVFWFSLFGPGAYTTTPELVGQSRSQAEDRLRSNGLDFEFVEAFSEEVRRGQVISTDPPAGENVRKNGSVQLVVSKGSEFVKTPLLIGQTEDSVRNALDELGLVLGTIRNEYSSTVDSGKVISQSPESGETLKGGDRVDVVFSKGPEPVTIPDVVGQDKATAVSMLEEAGLKVSVEQKNSDDVPAGAVISQSPSAGKGEKGDTVKLTVSKGADLVVVPNILGKTKEEARQMVEEAGLKPSFVTSIWGNWTNRVRNCSPSPGDKVKPGSTVTMEIA